MKNFKMYGIIGLFCSVLLLTGCGDSSHTLKCTLNSNNQEVSVEIEFDSDEKVAQSGIMDIVYKAGNGISEEMLNSSLDSIKDSVCIDTYKKCDVSIDGTEVSVHIEGSATDMSLTGTKEEMKAAVEEKGYKCE